MKHEEGDSDLGSGFVVVQYGVCNSSWLIVPRSNITSNNYKLLPVPFFFVVLFLWETLDYAEDAIIMLFKIGQIIERKLEKNLKVKDKLLFFLIK